MRSLWKGAVSFGLVHIPCRLYPATIDRDVHFRQVHRECGAPVAYHKFCPQCERRLAAEDIGRAAEVAPEEFVLLEDADLAELPLASTHTIQILDFVELASVDPLFFERPYLLGPAEAGARPYALFRAVLRRSGRAAVAKLALRAKESLCLLRVVEDCLILELMRYPDELRDRREVDGLPGEVPLPERELELAALLVDRLTGPWQPEKYHDEYRTALQDLLSRRAAGSRVRPAAAEAPAGRYADLLAALEASVAEAEARHAARGAEAP